MADPENHELSRPTRPETRPEKGAEDANLAREARLAAALRANLRRRKSGAKAPD